MRERVCLWLIIAARRVGRDGWADDWLAAAEKRQREVLTGIWWQD